MKFFLIIALLAFVALAAEKRFDDHALMRLRITSEKDFSKFFTFFPEDTIDVFSHDGGVSTKVDMDILFTPQQVTRLAGIYFNREIQFEKFEVLSRNYQVEIDAEKNAMSKLDLELEIKMLSHVTEKSRDDIRYSNEEFWKRYHNLVEIHGYISRLEDKHPEMMKKEVIGQSIENRTLTVYTIHAPGAYDAAKPALWINACQHAREWISPPTALYSIMKLLTGYESDPQVKAILDKINVFYLPFVNPDGYVHTWAGSRMWRKNRRVENGRVVGVDLNRNWRSGFGGPGSSGSPGSETYRGPRALSEPESAAVSKFLTKHPEIKAGVDFHAYSQLNLRPWGKQSAPSPDEAKLQALGKKMTDAIASVHRIQYQNIRSAGLYLASGILCDEFYENHKQMGYTIELRPSGMGGGGFALPPHLIIPTIEENWKAILAIAEYVRTGNI